MKWLVVILVSIVMGWCTNKSSKQDKAQYKQEIIQAEHDFAKMVKEQGLQAGFAFFADSNAVMRRADESLIIGKTAIEEHFGKSRYKDAILEWEVDFVDVAESGDLGYTYGRYTFVAKDSMGNLVKSAGVFHTVWKRQGDGTWRYVWD